MNTSPLPAPFGALLELDGTGDGAELRGLLAEYGLLVVRGREITREQQIEIVSQLGRVEPAANGEPMMMLVTNQQDGSTAPEGELVFHYDYAYDPEPITAISMYGLEIDAGATPTRFASSSRVLSQLPPDLVARLEGREAAHACFLQRPDAPDERNVEPEPLLQRGAEGWGPEHWWAHHPAIWKSAAGTPTLFLCLQHTDRILGIPREESDALLREIYSQMYHPGAVYEHAWRPMDLVIWDNLTVQHARPEPNALPRTLRRFHVSECDLTEEYLRVGRAHGFL